MDGDADDADKMKSLLAGLLIEDPDFGMLESSISEYCPFEAVGMVNEEIRHSAFLAHCIDPYRPHGFGADFLRLLLDTIVKGLAPPPVSRLELHLADFDKVDVRREWQHIDVLVVLPAIKLVVAFELKIGAGEGHDQLGRYSRAIEAMWPERDGWQHLKLFLTRSLDQPSDSSWHPVDYSVVTGAIDRFETESRAGSQLARDTLFAYANMLRRHHVGHEKLDAIADMLWKKHAEALNFLMERRPDADGGLGQMLLDRQEELAAAVSNDLLTLVPEKSSKRWVIFHVAQWWDIPNFNEAAWTPSGHFIQVQVEVDPSYVKLFVTLGPGPEEIRERFYGLCQDLMPKKAVKGVDRKTIYSRTILGQQAIKSADGAGELYERILFHLREWVRVEVAMVDGRLRPVGAGPRLVSGDLVVASAS